MKFSNFFDLWHVRLGQPSTFVVNKILRQSSLSVSRSNEPCIICLHAKQTRDIFPLSK